LNGLWKFYHPNGNLKQIGKYSMGKACGFWRYYNKEGNLLLEGNYANDVQVGIWNAFYPTGIIAGRVFYIKTNKPIYKWVYSDTGVLQK